MTPAVRVAQPCSISSCDEPAAFRTRSRPTWCDRHITALLGAGGLEPLEPFTGPKDFRLTRCMSCGCEAHYRFEYTLAKNAEGEATCRACFWRGWAARSRAMQGAYADVTPVDVDAVAGLAALHDYDYLGALSSPSLGDDPHLVRCRFCGRRSAQRAADIVWGCQCQVNPSRARQTAFASPGEEARSSGATPPVTAETVGPVSGLSPELTEQWHPTLNLPRQAGTVSPRSRKEFWWREASCGHEWVATPAERQKRQRLRCPECRTILDSLAYHFPAIAAEWAPENPTTAWHVRPAGQTSFTPTWVCSTNEAHRWQASVISRTTGSGCPECREPGKSRVELRHFDAALSVFGTASSGRSLHSTVFVRRSSWLVDIVVTLADGRELVIEYDGAYWHAGAEKTAVDIEKSEDLLRAGFLLVRLREAPLPPLPVNHPAYVEFPVSPTTPDPDAVIARVQAWVESLARATT